MFHPSISRITATTALLVASVLPSLPEQAFAQTARPAKVVVGDVELHYIEQGQGEPVILLHGGQGDYRAWQSLMEALVPRHRVISYSRRYHWPNANPLTAANHSALIDADDLAGLIAALRLGAVHLVGTSYGAFTALALAIKHPELVRSMVLAEPPVHSWVTGTARGATLYRERVATVHEPARRAFAAGNDEAAMRLFIDTFDGPGTFDGLPAERRTSILQNARFFKAITSSSDPFPNLPKDAIRGLRMPVLIVRGADTDELHRMVTEELGRLLPKADRLTVPRAGHGSPRQNPRVFNAAVLEFLDCRK
ncbi:MAG TPA: alpha/beta hydrolase [Thermoanaerobaculia bacterium]